MKTLRVQCLSHSVLLLTNIWISDDTIEALTLEPVYSPLTEFLMQGTVPRGFIHELFSYVLPKTEAFEKVIKTILNEFNIFKLMMF